MEMPSLHQLALMTALGLGACTTTAPAPELQAQATDTQADDDLAEAGLREHHRHQHRGGVTQFIAMSLDTLDPDDAQRPQVLQLQRDMYVCMAPAGAIQQRLHLTLAEGITAGAVDLAKVDGILVELDAADAGVRTCSVGGLNQLHALLTPAERGELAEKVQAHYEVWREATNEDGAASRVRGGRLARLTVDLGLSPDQVEKMSAALHTALAGRAGTYDRAKVDPAMVEFAQAFERPTFDATVTLPYANGRLGSHGASRMAIFYETVTPMLSPEQRVVLAAQVRAHAGQHPTISAK
ncbi:MAG: hypothetical protein IPO09_09940 [Anaeromyxobacter sp.]|nr:hypothetical protein [Anaeromyxobacter sp.]MBL0278567.1 hypothetical protein [Anaeromyxobacter sp.]